MDETLKQKEDSSNTVTVTTTPYNSPPTLLEPVTLTEPIPPTLPEPIAIPPPIQMLPEPIITSTPPPIPVIVGPEPLVYTTQMLPDGGFLIRSMLPGFAGSDLKVEESDSELSITGVSTVFEVPVNLSKKLSIEPSYFVEEINFFNGILIIKCALHKKPIKVHKIIESNSIVNKMKNETVVVKPPPIIAMEELPTDDAIPEDVLLVMFKNNLQQDIGVEMPENLTNMVDLNVVQVAPNIILALTNNNKQMTKITTKEGKPVHIFTDTKTARELKSFGIDIETDIKKAMAIAEEKMKGEG